MNSKKRSTALKIITIFAFIGFYSILLVMTKLENDRQLRNKLALEEELALKSNIILGLEAEIQKLQDEGRISKIAKEKFDLIKNFERTIKIEADYDEFKAFKQKLDELE